MATQADKRHLNKAVRVALDSEMTQRHGAVIARGRRVLATATNTFRTHPNNTEKPHREASFHAEENAIRKLRLREDLRGATLYVARVNRAGRSPRLSLPCAKCQRLIQEAGLKKVVFTDSESMGEYFPGRGL